MNVFYVDSVFLTKQHFKLIYKYILVKSLIYATYVENVLLLHVLWMTIELVMVTGINMLVLYALVCS